MRVQPAVHRRPGDDRGRGTHVYNRTSCGADLDVSATSRTSSRRLSAQVLFQRDTAARWDHPPTAHDQGLNLTTATSHAAIPRKPVPSSGCALLRDRGAQLKPAST